jgi:hypothetical protein
LGYCYPYPSLALRGVAGLGYYVKEKTVSEKEADGPKAESVAKFEENFALFFVGLASRLFNNFFWLSNVSFRKSPKSGPSIPFS